MPEHIAEKDTEREEMRKKVDEMYKLFESTKQNLDAIITMLDEILAQEEVLLSEKDQHCVGCTRNLSLEEQEFLRHGQIQLEP